MLELALVGVVGLNVWADFIDRKSARTSEIAALSLWTTIVQFLLIAPLIGLVQPIPLDLLLVCIAVAAFSVWARQAWFSALASRTHTLSRLAPITRLSSVVSLLLALVVLREPVSLAAGTGAAIVVIGALLIGFRKEIPDLRTYMAENKALLLVALFAISSATITALYKHSLNLGVGVVSTYFFLKTFQFLSATSWALSRGELMRSFTAVGDLRMFVLARAIQTVAALAYVFVLSRMPLTLVVPITALASPLIYIIVERISGLGSSAADPERTNRFIEVAGILTVSGGCYIMAISR